MNNMNNKRKTQQSLASDIIAELEKQYKYWKYMSAVTVIVLIWVVFRALMADYQDIVTNKRSNMK